MACHSYPMECLEGIPGFKAILKAVIKSQILALVNQLADQTGEQVVILTADVAKHTFGQFGSSDSTDFLTDRDEVLTDFLKHCIHKFNQRHHDGTTGEPVEDERGEKDTARKSTISQSSKVKRNHGRRAGVTHRVTESTAKKAPKRKIADEVTTEDDSGEAVTVKTTRSGGKVKKTKAVDRSMKSTYSIAVDDTVTDQADETDTPDNTGNSHQTSVSLGGITETSSDLRRNSNFSASISHSQEETEKETGNVEFNSDENSDAADEDVAEDDKEEFGDGLFGQGSKHNIEKDSITVCSGDKMTKVTKTGRRFISGQALDEDTRTSIVLQVVEQGGDKKTGSVPRGVFTKVGKGLGVNTSSVTRIWERYVNDGTITPRQTSSKK